MAKQNQFVLGFRLKICIKSCGLFYNDKNVTVLKTRNNFSPDSDSVSHSVLYALSFDIKRCALMRCPKFYIKDVLNFKLPEEYL